jgi:hypothetical protein
MDRRAFLTHALGLTGAAVLVVAAGQRVEAFPMVSPAPAAAGSAASMVMPEGEDGAKIEEAGWRWRRRHWRGRRCWRGRWGRVHCGW